MEAKKWYKSKMVWVNSIALVASLVQIWTGLILPAELQGAILTVINLILRAYTREEIIW